MPAFSVDPVYAVLSAMAYEAGRREPNRLTGIRPGGATYVDDPSLAHYIDPNGSGFEASAFNYNGQIVIAYAGTLFTGLNPESAPDLRADALLGVGVVDPQLAQAAEFYTKVKQKYGDNIVFTGHSLGGGLAAVMGAFFDKQAITFDPAPFRLAATKVNADTIARYLVSKQLPVDAALSAYTTTESTLAETQPQLIPLLAAAGIVVGNWIASWPYPTSVRGEANISAYALDGEFLTNGWQTLASLFNDLRLKNTAQPEIMQHGGVGVLGAMRDLHSITLLSVFARKPRLAELSQQLPGLLPSLFDRGLYSEPPGSATTDVLVKLLQRQYDPANAVDVLGAFAGDLEKLLGNTGLAQTQPGVRDGLIAAAIEYYYHQDTPTQFFTMADGRVSFKWSDIGASKLKSLPRLAAAVEAYLAPEDQSYATYLLGKNAWHIQQGSGQLNWTETEPQNDAVIGGVGVDIVNAGAGADIVFGNAGVDALNGGAGNDILIGGLDIDFLNGGEADGANDVLRGGKGADEYQFTGAFGHDVVEDSDGEGQIKFQGSPLPAGKKLADNQWRSDDGQWTYVFSPAAANSSTGTLFVLKTGGANTITIRNYTLGQLGITLEDTPATLPPPSSALTGDFNKAVDVNDPTQYVFDAQGNYVAAGAQPDAADLIAGRGRTQRMRRRAHMRRRRSHAVSLRSGAHPAWEAR